MRSDEQIFTHLDLFSGIGGFAIAAQCAGFRTVAFVERDPYCQKILAQHWPNVTIYGDIHQFGGRSLGPISLLTGGFPCQPFSVAGEQRGAADDRYLWPEMFRVIQTTKPDWIIGENVTGLDGLGLNDCISDLESIGYEVAPPLEIPACGVGAPHLRFRVWIIANLSDAGSSRIASSNKRQEYQQDDRAGIWTGVESNLPTSSDANSSRLEGLTGDGGRIGNWSSPRRPVAPSLALPQIEIAPHFDGQRELQPEGLEQDFWRWDIDSNFDNTWVEAATEFCGMVHGVSNRPHRIKGLGNAIVPQVAYQITKAIFQHLATRLKG
jgi:DNA (cytosine-5)-methyltransferase 1